MKNNRHYRDGYEVGYENSPSYSSPKPGTKDAAFFKAGQEAGRAARAKELEYYRRPLKSEWTSDIERAVSRAKEQLRDEFRTLTAQPATTAADQVVERLERILGGGSGYDEWRSVVELAINFIRSLDIEEDK